jgi:AraC-like DNA-binding protein
MRYIRRNLEGSLSPIDLCAALRVSRSHLYRLFREEGSVAGVIRSEQLAAAREVLAEPSDARRIHRVAADFGFGSAEEFSRAFRRAFGCRPSEIYRRGPVRSYENDERKGISNAL